MTQTELASDASSPGSGAGKIWAHSADSHVLEPADLWTSRLPKRLADRAPRSERGDKYESPLHRRTADRPSAQRLHGRDAAARSH